MAQPATLIGRDRGVPGPSHSPRLRPTSPARHVSDGDGHGFPLPDQHDKLLAAGDAGVEKVSLQHRVVLRHHRDDHSRVLRALALVNGGGIGGYQHVELAKPVGHRSAVEVGDETGDGGFIPACAGVAVNAPAISSVARVHPCVCAGAAMSSAGASPGQDRDAVASSNVGQRIPCITPGDICGLRLAPPAIKQIRGGADAQSGPEACRT
jgi:hypothetical protein